MIWRHTYLMFSSKFTKIVQASFLTLSATGYDNFVALVIAAYEVKRNMVTGCLAKIWQCSGQTNRLNKLKKVFNGSKIGLRETPGAP